MDGWVGGWMGGWREVKAGLRIAYSNQKKNLIKGKLLQCFCRNRRIVVCRLCRDDHPPDAVQAPEQCQHTSPGVSRVGRGRLSEPSSRVCWRLDLIDKDILESIRII